MRPRHQHALTVPQIARLLKLANAGLSDAGIAVVFGVDYGLEMGRGHVQGYRRRYAAGGPGASKAKVGVRKDMHANSPLGREMTSAVLVEGLS